MTAAATKLIREGERVVELGAQLRDVSSAICERVGSSGSVICLDVIRKFPKSKQPSPSQRTKAMRQQSAEVNFYSDRATFIEMECLDDWRQILVAQPNVAYDVLVLDVNSIVGNDLEWTALAILREFTHLFPTCQTALVKSVSLNQWASRLIPGQRWICKRGIHNDIPPPHYIATIGVSEYRKTIPFVIKEHDRVLEIGCHLGTTTALLDSAPAEYCIGVDIGHKIIQGAQQRHPETFFAVGDAWKTASLLQIQQDYLKSGSGDLATNSDYSSIGFDVVYVDVGGLSGSDGLFEALVLLQALSNALEPRVIVMKSLCVHRLSSSLRPAWHIVKKKK